MKLDKRTAIIGGVLLITSTFLVINRIRKKRLYNDLMKDLQAGSGSGDQTETGSLTLTGGPLNPATFQNTPGGRLQPLSVVQADIEKINKWIHGFLGSSDEKSLLAYFQGLKSQTQVSQVAYEYQKKYGISLAEDLKFIDYTPLGISTGSFDIPKIIEAIKALPLK